MSTPSLIQIASKVSPILVGTFQAPVQIINNSALDTVWIGTDSTVSANAGIPLQAQSAMSYGSGTIVEVWAILDPAASAPVQLILGGDATDWQPSPVKVVNISGPVAVTGTVSISGTVNVAGSVSISSGTVNVGVISGTVTITGPVTVTNTPSVIPQGNIALIQQSASGGIGPGTTGVTINIGSIYNTAVLQLGLTYTGAGNPLAAIPVVITGTNTNGSGNLYATTVYLKPTSGYTAHFVTGLDSTLLVIPLNGMNQLTLSFVVPASYNMQYQCYGSNQQLEPSYRSIQQISGPYLFEPTGRIAVAGTGGTPVQVEIPITSNPVTIYLYSSGTATGVPLTTVTICDELHPTVLRQYVTTGVAKSTQVGPIKLPNTLTPVFLQFDETVAAATSQWEVLIQEEKLPAAA